ncbi:MAG: glycosyltransferase family 4 protein [Isosphaeraceae bacterium]
MTEIAMLYDDDAYVEAPGGSRRGLMGRQVAGREFLNAYLAHGSWDALTAVVPSRNSASSLLKYCREHPSSRKRVRRVRLVERADFLDVFFPSPPARVFYHPAPPEESFAWARQHGGPGSFALCGVTHTLSSLGAVQALRALVTAPFEPYDALICTSRAVERVVRTVTERFADSLRDRFGGAPGARASLEVIPLGVDPDQFRPATPEERAATRSALGVAEEEVAVLFVGRLSHHAKAHPFPMFEGLAEARRVTGRPIHLLLAGWAAHPAVLEAFRDGARRFAEGVRVSFLDGQDPAIRRGVWHAADLFVSPSDNVQETFGLVVVEAMAAGLPVIASDWDGYRDLVVEGETGLLVPTLTVADATVDATTRLMLGAIDYDHFLAECNQSVTVDPVATAAALTRLVGDSALRQRLGAAGRRRALDHFAWSRVITAYESLWRSQEAERQARNPRVALDGRRGTETPSAYPSPERTFASYPTRRLSNDDHLVAPHEAASRLPSLLDHPLTHYAPSRRIIDETILLSLLATAGTPTPIHALDAHLRRLGVAHSRARATIAWLLKYGLLRAI